MSNLNFRLWHLKEKRMFQVVLAFLGLGTQQAQVQTSETTLKLSECDVMEAIGELDVKKENIFKSDIVRLTKKIGKKEILVEGIVTYKNAAFVIEYEEENEEGTIERKYISSPEWQFCKVVGNIYQPPKKAWEK